MSAADDACQAAQRLPSRPTPASRRRRIRRDGTVVQYRQNLRPDHAAPERHRCHRPETFAHAEKKLATELQVSKIGDRIFRGLIFTETAVTRADPSIAEIPDPATRAKTLFDYLQNWVPPELLTAPEPDPLLSSILINGQLELAPAPPTEPEQHERLKRALHDRLQEKACHIPKGDKAGSGTAPA